MENQGGEGSDDTYVEDLPVEILTDLDVNMDHVEEVDTECEATGDGGASGVPAPDNVAAETVVTTSQQLVHPGSLQFQLGGQPVLVGQGIMNGKQLHLFKAENYKGALAAQFNGSSVLTTSGRYDMHYTPLVALSPDSEEKLFAPETKEQARYRLEEKFDSQAQHKRTLDRIKKRKLRSNPDFREKEKVEAKGRMRALRADPEYRQREREKDRLRRRLARQKNIDGKAKAKSKATGKAVKQTLDTNIFQIGSDQKLLLDAASSASLGLLLKGGNNVQLCKNGTISSGNKLEAQTQGNKSRNVPTPKSSSSTTVPKIESVFSLAEGDGQSQQTVTAPDSSSVTYITTPGTKQLPADRAERSGVASGSKGRQVKQFVITYDQSKSSSKRVPP